MNNPSQIYVYSVNETSKSLLTERLLPPRLAELIYIGVKLIVESHSLAFVHSPEIQFQALHAHRVLLPDHFLYFWGGLSGDGLIVVNLRKLNAGVIFYCMKSLFFLIHFPHHPLVAENAIADWLSLL